MLRTLLLLVCLTTLCSIAHSSSSHRHVRSTRTSAQPPPVAPFPWFNYSMSLNARVSALVSALTTAEKLSLMSNKHPAMPRLGLPYYDFESEGSHGVARAGRATVFPSPIALASTFDAELSHAAGQVLAMEGRGKFNDYIAKHGGNNTRWYSLDFLAPNINLFLHPLWGRGQETYGECPFLVSEMSTAYVLGMQNWNHSAPDTSYVEAGATCKVQLATLPHPCTLRCPSLPSSHSACVCVSQHFFAYGDSVYNNRVNISETDVQQTYHPMFKSCVMRGHARSLMCAYSSPNGYQSCEHPALRDVVRGEWASTASSARTPAPSHSSPDAIIPLRPPSPCSTASTRTWTAASTRAWRRPCSWA